MSNFAQQKKASFSFQDPITGQDLWMMAVVLAVVLLASPVIRPTIHLMAGYISDVYHIHRVEGFVEQALSVQQDTRLDLEMREKRVKSLQNAARYQNHKIVHLAACNEEAIDVLDVKALRRSTIFKHDIPPAGGGVP